MQAKRLIVVGGAGLVSVLTLLSMSHLLADKGGAVPKTYPLTEAAMEAYRCAQASFLTNKATVEDIYRWSKRAGESGLADGNAKALDDHAARMQELYDRIEKLSKVGAPQGSALNYASTKFYALEAQTAVGKRLAQ